MINQRTGNSFGRVRLPHNNNPMMNVPITAYDTHQKYDDYDRYLVGNGFNAPLIKEETESDLLKKLFQDPGDKIFDRMNSQRQWYSMPVGSVPSDQTEFAENLYGREYVCKSGSIWSRYDIAYTDDSLACTGFEGDGAVTNFGQIQK